MNKKNLLYILLIILLIVFVGILGYLFLGKKPVAVNGDLPRSLPQPVGDSSQYFDLPKEVVLIKEQFIQEYMNKKPWSKYINGVGISKVGLKDPNAPADRKDDLCISVYLLKDPPTSLKLPSQYHGINVYYKVTGEIQFQ